MELVPEALPDQEQDRPLPFWTHVGELRSRLLRSMGAIALAGIGCYSYRFQLWELAKRPLLMGGFPSAVSPFAYTDLAEPFFSMMKLSVWAAVFVVSPYLFWELWGFVRPALKPAERSMATTFVLVTSGCFVAGALFAYYVAFPLLGRVLAAEALEAGLRANLRPSEYLNLFLYTVLGAGISFEAPVLFYFLGRFGLVSSAGMLRYWRESTLAMLAASAFFTPGDVLAGTLLFGTVLLALYFVSAGVVWLTERR